MTVSAKVKQTTANLKGSQSALRAYAVHSEDEDDKAVFQEALERVQTIVVDLENRIKTLEFEEPQYKGY